MQDDLEIHLRALKPRSLPPSWRREILATCARQEREPWFARLGRALYPGPAPAAVLGALWLLILGFFLNTPPEPPALPGHLDIAAARAARAERQLLLAQLNDMERGSHPGVTFAVPLRTGRPNR